MNRKYLMMAAVSAALAGPVAAHAQQTESPSMPAPAPQSTPMPNSQDASTNPRSYGNAPAVTPAAQDATPASATVGGDTQTMANPAAPATTDANGVQVITNGPVPDTPANRAKYGKPMSMGGRMTKPAGN